jgi:hypothetical protein
MWRACFSEWQVVPGSDGVACEVRWCFTSAELGLISASTRPNMMGSFVFSFFGLVLLDYISIFSIFTYY